MTMKMMLLPLTAIVLLSTTVLMSSGFPMAQVQLGWYAESALERPNASS